MLSAAAIKALDQIDKHPEMLRKLQERSSSLHQSICHSELVKHFTLGSDEISPLKHLYLIDKSLLHSEEQIILKNIVDYVSNSFVPFAALSNQIYIKHSLKNLLKHIYYLDKMQF